jgi:hypothetical protein
MTSSVNAIQRCGPSDQASVRIYPDGHSHWCARKNDGLVAGIFFNCGAAIRFVRHESGDWPAPKPSFLRDEVSLRTFVGLLLVGRAPPVSLMRRWCPPSTRRP